MEFLVQTNLSSISVKVTKVTSTKDTFHGQKNKRCGKKKTNTEKPQHQEKIKRKQLLDELDADDEDFIPDKANRKDPPENIGKKNPKDLQVKIGKKKSNAINLPETIANMMSKLIDGYSNSDVNATVSLPFLADEVDGNKPKWQAFVAINYSPQIGGSGMYMHSLLFQFCLMVCIHRLLFSCSLNSFIIQIHIIL